MRITECTQTDRDEIEKLILYWEKVTTCDIDMVQKNRRLARTAHKDDVVWKEIVKKKWQER